MKHTEDDRMIASLPDFARGTFSLGKRGPKLYYRQGEDYEEILKNNREYLAGMGAAPEELVTVNQKHTARVYAVTGDRAPGNTSAGGTAAESDTGGNGYDLKRERIPETDGLVTNIPGIVLGVYVADCSAVFLADPESRSVGLCHAGRRGALNRICRETVRQMQENFGAEPDNIHAWISPCICSSCYEIGPEVVEETRRLWGEKADMVLIRNPETGRMHFDLKKANRIVLEEAGLKASNIIAAPECTCCSRDVFYSYRGDGGIISEMAAYLTIKR
ncbi:MAG: peptidoglycan editing factor PgeF [Lentihominibacter sp.]